MYRKVKLKPPFYIPYESEEEYTFWQACWLYVQAGAFNILSLALVALCFYLPYTGLSALGVSGDWLGYLVPLLGFALMFGVVGKLPLKHPWDE